MDLVRESGSAAYEQKGADQNAKLFNQITIFVFHALESMIG